MSNQEIQLIEIKPICYEAVAYKDGCNCIISRGWGKESAVESLIQKMKKEYLYFRVQTPSGFWVDEREFNLSPNALPINCGIGVVYGDLGEYDSYRRRFFAVPVGSKVVWSFNPNRGIGSPRKGMVESKIKPINEIFWNNIEASTNRERYMEHKLHFPEGSYFWFNESWHPTRREYDIKSWEEEFKI